MQDDGEGSILTGYEIVDRIRQASCEPKKAGSRIFQSSELSHLGEAVQEVVEDTPEHWDLEWRRYNRVVQEIDGKVAVGVTHDELFRFKKNLSELEDAYLKDFLTRRDEAFENLIFQGQEVLRRYYFAVLLKPGKEISLSRSARTIIEVGAASIQVLGRSPGGPKHPYRMFKEDDDPSPDSLGIEILTSGAFPDWRDPYLCELREQGRVDRVGFEKVMQAYLDTPRSLVLAKALDDGRRIYHLDFPKLNRVMLDLELMRLGQATTPGTYNMLLNSFYQGALFVDHSTNVSEQVQLIFSEEKWKPAWVLENADDWVGEAGRAADALVEEYYRFASESPVGRDHPREARILFSPTLKPDQLTLFFRELKKALKLDGEGGDEDSPRISPVHEILPTLNPLDVNRLDGVQVAVGALQEAGFERLAIIAESVRHRPGLLQYFESESETNEVIQSAREKGVKLIDGRTIDMVATANKTIEAAAGAIESGQGCIKVGLLGLTLEEMTDFIGKVKQGLGSRFRREENQFLVFIGIIDEPVVGTDRVLTDPYQISEAFLELMSETGHDLLLLDTIHKGKAQKRFVDAGDTKGGHLTRDQVRQLVRTARKDNIDLWVAGSYTEDLVYRTAQDDPDERPSLICLGGAERSFGGIRLEPRDAYEPSPEDTKGQILSTFLDCQGDVKHILSRDNKLARDAGHLVGTLRRIGHEKEAELLEELRKRYLQVREECVEELKNAAFSAGSFVGNIDQLFEASESLSREMSEEEGNRLKQIVDRFRTLRKEYVTQVSDKMYDLFADEWFGSPEG